MTGLGPTLSWGQDGEDILLLQLLPSTGRFVDVGAHHPTRFSSTKLLYDRGWSGLNVDVTPEIVELFPRLRPRDISHFGLAGKQRQTVFWRFREGALSTFDEQLALERMREGWEVESRDLMDVRPLDEILKEHNMPREIDLLCIDVEGADLEVLETVDFDYWTIRRVLVEIHEPAWRVEGHPVAKYLSERNFVPVAVWLRSALFELSE